MSEEMLEKALSIKKKEREEGPYLVYEYKEKVLRKERITLPSFLSHKEKARPEIELLLEYLRRGMRTPSPTIEELEEKITRINQRVKELEVIMRKLEQQAQYGSLIIRTEVERENLRVLFVHTIMIFSLFLVGYSFLPLTPIPILGKVLGIGLLVMTIASLIAKWMSGAS